MKAILTRYHGPTDTKPSRITARAEGVPNLTLANAEGDEGHRAAAQALCNRMDWTGTLTMGGLPDGFCVHVFTPAVPALRALAHAVIHNTMPRTNPYTRPVVVKALEALAHHDDWHGDTMDVPLEPN